MNHLKKIIFYFLVVCIVAGCEYALQDNYIDIKKPDGEIQLGIYLDAQSDGDSLFLLDYSNIHFNLEIPDYEMRQCVFKFGNQERVFNEPFGEFGVSAWYDASGQYALTCDVYVASGSGSLADQLGAEFFYGTFSWPVKFLTEPQSSLTHKVNEEGFLELSWARLQLPESTFICYKVYRDSELCAVITDINQSVYVSETYIGGPGVFSVIAELKDMKVWSLGSVSFTGQEVEVAVDYADDDSVTLSWKNAYQSRVTVVISSDTVVSYSDQQSVRLPCRLFGTGRETASFSFYPMNDDQVSFVVWRNLYLGKGVCIAPQENWPRIGYNLQEDVLYVSSYHEISSWLLPDCEKLMEHRGNYINNVHGYAISVYDRKMAARYYHYRTIELIEGKEMKSVKSVSLQNPEAYFTGPMVFTKDGKLICFKSNHEVKGLVLDAETGALEAEFDLPPEISGSLDAAKMTPDAHYMIIKDGSSYLTFLTIENNRVIRSERSNLLYSGFCFNTFTSDEFYLSYEGMIYRYDCRDLSIKNVWVYPEMKVGNVDPKTGYLLLYGSNMIKIIDPIENRLVYTMPVADGWAVPQLYGNMLISYGGYALNLEKQLKK